MAHLFLSTSVLKVNQSGNKSDGLSSKIAPYAIVYACTPFWTNSGAACHGGKGTGQGLPGHVLLFVHVKPALANL